MSIWLAGDTHGEINIDKVVEYFDDYTEYCTVTKDDYLIILGDAGVIWDRGFGDLDVQRILSELPCTVLWIDGNHENFDGIEDLEVTEDWHGGKVQFVTEDIIHLMRGQVYEIEGKTFFTFGGGLSIDRAYRTPYRSWWPQEMPSKEEYDEGIRNLERVGNKVDYILTHTCPRAVAKQMVDEIYPGEETLQHYFTSISRTVEYDEWYFGHWHMDFAMGNFRCLWEEIIQLDEEE